MEQRGDSGDEVGDAGHTVGGTSGPAGVSSWEGLFKFSFSFGSFAHVPTEASQRWGPSRETLGA